MEVVKIKQQDDLTHTIFSILECGRCFPEENYKLAKKWLEKGLLDNNSKRVMELIEKEREW